MDNVLQPLFSSGPHGSGPAMRELWRLLDAHDVDVVVSAHDHLYERFSPQDADGRFDATGVRQFTVGTGGATLYSVVRQAANSEERLPMHGIVRFTLRPGFYNWEFLALSGTVADLGFGSSR